MAKTKKKEDPKDIENNSHEEYTPEGTSKKKYKRDSFVFLRSFYNAFKRLKEKDPAAALEYVDIIFDYGLNYEEPDESHNVSALALFDLAKGNIDANTKRWVASVSNGKQGGRPKNTDKESENLEKPNNNLEKPNTNLNVNDNVNVNVNDNVNVNVNDNVNDNVNVNDVFDNNILLSHTHKEIKNKESVCVDEEKNNFKSYSCHLNRVYKDSLGECADCKKRFSCKIKDISDDPDLYNAKKRAKAIMNKEIIEADNDFSSKEKKELAPAKWVTKREDY